MNYQSSDAQSFQSSTPSYMQAAYSPQFLPNNMSSSPNFVIASTPSHYHHHHQHFSHSTKANSIRYGSNSELSKRTRNHQSHGYELSQDLIDKQIELLERKYGGKIRAQRAALVSYFKECVFCT
jgi:hypothetical protein